MNSGISLMKILGGLSKTLSIANQVLPLIKKAKPLLGKGLNIFSDVTNNINNSRAQKNTKNDNKVINNNNSPTFFV